MARKIYHVQLKDPSPEEREHTYFGSQRAIFNFWSPSRLGIKYDSLRGNYNLAKSDYNGKRCIVRLGTLHTFREENHGQEQESRE